jgi:hypothetical protein
LAVKYNDLDPWLALSYTIWPTPAILEAEQRFRPGVSAVRNGPLGANPAPLLCHHDDDLDPEDDRTTNRGRNWQRG